MMLCRSWRRRKGRTGVHDKQKSGLAVLFGEIIFRLNHSVGEDYQPIAWLQHQRTGIVGRVFQDAKRNASPVQLFNCARLAAHHR